MRSLGRDMPRDRSILLNAEAFGFGPAAAIAEILPHLRTRFARIGYLGAAHTLDLQRGLPYDEIHDVTGLDTASLAALLRDVAPSWDALLTATDFTAAELALAAGMKVYFYDMLTYYWRDGDLPEVLQRVDLYIAQDFVGVRERLRSLVRAIPRSVVVPPLIGIEPRSADERLALLGLGGLENPLWTIDEAVAYARACLDAARATLPPGWSLRVAASRAVCRALGAPEMATLDKEEMRGVLRRCRYALMVPGLANIYEAAAFDLPTLWLPPASDSHGCQLRLLHGQGLADAHLDWHDVLDAPPLDYSGPQEEIVRGIAERALRLADDVHCRQRFRRAVAAGVARLLPRSRSATRQLLDRFGSGGASVVADLLHERLCAAP